MIHSFVTFASIRLTGKKSNFYFCLFFLVAQRSKTIGQIPLVTTEERRGKRPGLCWLLVSTGLSEGVTSEVLNHTCATTVMSTSNLFLDDKKE